MGKYIIRSIAMFYILDRQQESIILQSAKPYRQKWMMEKLLPTVCDPNQRTNYTKENSELN
jgi:hypothetical protein